MSDVMYIFDTSCIHGTFTGHFYFLHRTPFHDALPCHAGGAFVRVLKRFFFVSLVLFFLPSFGLVSFTSCTAGCCSY